MSLPSHPGECAELDVTLHGDLVFDHLTERLEHLATEPRYRFAGDDDWRFLCRGLLGRHAVVLDTAAATTKTLHDLNTSHGLYLAFGGSEFS